MVHERVRKTAVGIVLAIGVLVLSGWAIGSERLVAVHLGWFPMWPDAAACFMLVAGSLFLVWRGAAVPARLLAGLAMLVAIATLMESFLYLGVSWLAVLTPPPGLLAPEPGHMPTAAAVNVLLLGAGVWLASGTGRSRALASQVAAGLVFVNTLPTGVAYLLGVAPDDFLPYMQMAAAGPPCYLLLAGALALTRPEVGFLPLVTSPTAGGVVVRRLLPLGFGVPLLFGGLGEVLRRAGWLPFHLLGALYVALAMILCAIFIVWNAGSLDRMERAAEATREALRRAETRYRLLVECGIVGVVEVAQGGTIPWANQAFLDLVGRRPEDLPLSSEVLTPPDRRDQDRAAAEILRRAGVVPPLETEYIHRAGHRVPVLLGAAVLEDADERCLALVMDMSQQKRVEAELRRALQDLERTNADLEQFAFVASHDLQEPLRMVSSFVQLLEQKYGGQLGPEADRYIHYAVDGSRRMQALILDLLRYSRAGRTQSEGHADLGEALRRATASLALAIRESGARLEADPLPVVRGNLSMLTQVLQNLLENAIKYRRDVAPEIRVEVRPRGEQWVLSVRDNGIGIEAPYHERIFQIFQRLHDRASYPGTGLGLALVRRIVERHGGTVWVESVPGQGSTFQFTLPRTEADEVPTCQTP